jgi:hypothetical protein
MSEELTEAQELVRIALIKDRTKVGLAKILKVSRETIHLWNTGQVKMSDDNTAAVMALIGMDENDSAEVGILKAKLEEKQREVWDVEEKLVEAEQELKGYQNGETEREMRAVSMRFAEMADGLMEEANSIEDLKADNEMLTKRVAELEARFMKDE